VIITEDMIDRAAAVIAEVTCEPRVGRFERIMAREVLRAGLGSRDREVCTCHRDPDGTMYGGDFCPVHRVTDRENGSES